MADKEKKNIKALKGFRLRVEDKDDEGNVVVSNRHVGAGEVVAKGAFGSKSEWLNLCNMTPPRAEETDEKVGKAPAPKADEKKLPGAK